MVVSRSDSPSRWIVVHHDFGHEDSEVEAMFVDAPTGIEAAAKAAGWLRELYDKDGDNAGDSIDRVFVAPWDGRVAYAVEARFDATKAKHQCCGGPSREVGDHFGGCPTERER